MRFEPLFDVGITHDYYGTGLCPVVELAPDVSTRGLEARAGLVIRSSPGSIAVYYDADSVDTLRMHAAEPNGLRLVFRLRATDSALASYTDPDTLGGDAIHYYSSHAAKHADDGEATWDAPDRITDDDFDRIEQLRRAEKETDGVVHRDEKNSDVLLRSLRADARLLHLSSVVEPRDRFVRPLAIVAIFFALPGKGDRFPPAVPSRFRFGFRALRTIWKYYLLGDLSQKESAVIADLQGDGDVAEFERGPKEDLPGNRVALTFRSRAPIPLRLRAERRLQLRENGKVLIRRLPVAAPDGIGSVELADGKKRFVSDIYVNG
jgi:hypothetical protein